MKVLLPPRIQKIIDDRVKSGKYHSAEDVISAAVASLEQDELFGDFKAGELEALLAEGERDIEAGEVLDGAEVFAELRRRSAARRGNGR
jgi:antitoxin ParD1/3/4